jgi:hypothetical protein
MGDEPLGARAGRAVQRGGAARRDVAGPCAVLEKGSQKTKIKFAIECYDLGRQGFISREGASSLGSFLLPFTSRVHSPM